MASAPGILLTVIGGFLGAGKTTLLNHVLRDAGDRRLAVLVNDFGAINIDAELIESREGEMLTLTNGCICCAIGGDFIAALASLRDVDDPPDQVVVEASGVADPGQIAIFGDMPGYARDAVVVVADAETVRARAEAEDTGPGVLAQLRAADLLVISKPDLVEPAALEEVRGWLRDIVGPSTSIVEAERGRVPADVLLGAHRDAGRLAPAARRAGEEPEGATDPQARAAHDHAGLDHAGHDQAGEAHAAHDDAGEHHAAHDHAGHDHADFHTWSFAGADPLSGAGLVEAIAAFPEGIVRAKGILHLREDAATRYELQLVGRRYSIEPTRPWGDDEPGSRIVVIGLPGLVDAAALDATMARLSAAEPAASAGG